MVLDSDLGAATCVVRPPGHHSECGCTLGFGLVNSVAMAAQFALTSGRAERVLIVDWDIHHGNGTQEIFASSPNCLYFSAHELQNFPAFAPNPGGRDRFELASPAYVGDGEGTGFTCNVAWMEDRYGDAEYALMANRLLIPIAKAFKPELILISAGFDSAAGDECGFEVTPAGYAYLTRASKSLLFP